MKSMFARQAAQITVLLLLILAALGGVLHLGLSSFLSHRQEEDLATTADAVADMSRAYGSAEELARSWDLRMSLSVAGRVSRTDVAVCDTEGRVLVCGCSDFSCPHLFGSIPKEMAQAALEQGSIYLTDSLPELFGEERSLRCQLLTAQDGSPLGVALVSAPTADVTAFVRAMLRVFLYLAAAVWLVALPVTLIMSRHETKPLKDMAAAVRRFGHGDLAARATLGRRSTAEMDELAAAFNNMADTLEKSEKVRAEFVANVSHELKTPMTSIAGYLDGMLDGTIPQEMHAHYMGIVTDEVRRLSRLIRTMLEVSRMQADGIRESQKTRFDLGEAVTRTLLRYEDAIRKRRLEVEVDLPEEPVCTVAHEDSVMQVVSNLLDNAVKFCSDCGYLTLSLRVEGAKALVTVKNTGPVIPSSELPHIFDRFHKLDKSRGKDPAGVGLGLYIVKTIVGAHGEEIWVESHDGVTAFTFTMPAVK